MLDLLLIFSNLLALFAHLKTKMMKLFFNNKEIDTEARTLQQLAQELSLPDKGIAVAADNKLVPRTDWDAFLLTEGTHIVVIKAVCGG
ncbi:MAG: sulfur carrier protein ThiS [Bacteroidales bacterium]|nr:sulfur carrier protein ThiS [Bacteroidales bacterium]